MQNKIVVDKLFSKDSLNKLPFVYFLPIILPKLSLRVDTD